MARGRKQRKRERRAKENELKESVQFVNDVHLQHEQIGNFCEREPLSIKSIFKNDDLQEISNLIGVTALDDSHTLLGGIALGRFDVIKKLLNNGSCLENNKKGGLTPMLWAVKMKQIGVIDFLLRRGANINALDPDENNALLLALQIPSWDQDTFLDFWNLIKDSNINFNRVNKSGSCALHYMVKRQWDVGLEMILSNPKVNINVLTKKGVSAMMMACSRHQERTFLILFKYNANVLIEDERGCTALCYAIAYFMQKSIKLPNKIIKVLLDYLKDSESLTSVEEYLQQRLELITNTPLGKYYYTTSSIVMYIFTFFSGNVQNGLEMLLDLKLLEKIKIATERNIKNIEYCLYLFNIASDVIIARDKTDNNIKLDELGRILNESNLLELLLIFIKKYGVTSLDSKDLYSILRPLLYLSNHTIIRCWLQRNFQELASSCNFILSINSSQYYPNENRLLFINENVDDFIIMMKQLFSRELTYRDDKNKKKRYDVRSRSVGQEDWSMTNNNMELGHKKSLSSRKSEENFRTLNICGNVETNLKQSEIIESQETLEIGDNNLSFNKNGTYCTRNSSYNVQDSAFEDEEKYVASKWQEEFKDGYKLFGISPDTLKEERPVESFWDIDICDEDPDNSILKNNEDNKNESTTIETQSLKQNENDFARKIDNLDMLVKSMLKYYQDAWTREYTSGYIDIMQNKENQHHLLRVIPPLEKYYIGKFTSSWIMLSCKLQQKWKENKEEAIKVTDQLISYVTEIVKQLEFQETLSYEMVEAFDDDGMFESKEREYLDLINKGNNVDNTNPQMVFKSETDFVQQNEVMHQLKRMTIQTSHTHIILDDNTKLDNLQKVCCTTQNIRLQEVRPILGPEYMFKKVYLNSNNEIIYIGVNENNFLNNIHPNRKQIFFEKQVFFEGPISNSYCKLPPSSGFLPLNPLPSSFKKQ